MTGNELTTDEILSQCAEVFSEEYATARELHLRHEVSTGERNVQTLANFRDALEHMSRVIIELDENNPEIAKEEIILVRDHLERIIYDGSKRPVQANVSYLKENRVNYNLYRIALLDAPTKVEFDRQMESLKELYYDGREGRDEQSLEAANEIAEQLKRETPTKRQVYFRLLVVLSALATLLLVSSQLMR